jgi:Domain of unknown function (DUF1992)
MSNWYETRVDRQLREAQERGDFDNLPGTGKPLPNRGEHLDDEWWIKGLIQRESLSGALPPALALRKEIEELPARVARKQTEAAVRGVVAELNDRIMLARRGPVNGPPVTLGPVDADAVIRAWRGARAAASATVPAEAPAAARRPWWRRRRAA